LRRNVVLNLRLSAFICGFRLPGLFFSLKHRRALNPVDPVDPVEMDSCYGLIHVGCIGNVSTRPEKYIKMLINMLRFSPQSQL
jgi:hypothetical protein